MNLAIRHNMAKYGGHGVHNPMNPPDYNQHLVNGSNMNSFQQQAHYGAAVAVSQY